jgi:YD repeat-containing protein
MNFFRRRLARPLAHAAHAALAVLSAIPITPAHADGVDEPIPSFYQEAGLSPTRAYVNQHSAEHLDPFSGKVQWHFTDFFLPGNGGLDLAVQRSYSSLDDKYPESSPAGVGWTMHFGRVLRRSTVDICDLAHTSVVNPVLELADGSRHILYVGVDGFSFITTGFWRADCVSNGSPGLTVFSPDGTRYEMTAMGMQLGDPVHPINTYYPSRITDRNGNWMAISYAFFSNTFGVTGVTTSDGRSLTYAYDAAGMIKSVTDGLRTWDYTVEGGFLTEVKRPDNASWKFAYNALAPGNVGQASLNKVTYPGGGTIQYTYGEMRFSDNFNLPRSHVVMTKTADGGYWTFTYKPATEALPADVSLWTDFPDAKVDVTTVSGPDGTRVYRHIGYTSAPSGGVMHIGQPVDTLLGTAQAMGYSHNIQLISYQANIRPGDTLTFDPQTYASIDWGTNINRNGQKYNTGYDALDEFGNPGVINEEGTDSRQTGVSYFVDTGRWILHRKKDEAISVTIPEGGGSVGSIARTFDANANMLTETRFGVPTTYTYTPEGDVRTRTDARGNTIQYAGYKRGIPQNEAHPEGVTISRVVDDGGNVTSETDGENATTAWQYDGLNRPTRITHPAGNPVNVAWTPTSRTTTRGNYKEVVSYDAFGREAQVVHTDTSAGGAGSVTVTYKNDILGRRIFTSYPNNAALGTYKVLDILGQTSIVYFSAPPDGSSYEAGQGYSRLANVNKFQNERGLYYTQTYRNFGNPDERLLMSVAAPDTAASLAMKRNGAGQLTQVTQDGKARSFGWDSHYFLTSQVDPETGTTTYGRDQVGNMTGKQVGAASAISYGYDGRNRLTSVVYGDGGSVTRSYYKDDKLQLLANGGASRSYTYDANKNLVAESMSIGTQTFSVSYAYNANDALDSTTYGTGTSLTYGPDGFGRPTQAAPYVSTIAHHPSGAISSMTYANGVQTTIGLNTRQWPATLKVAKGAAMFDKTYFYDQIGNVIGINDIATQVYPRMSYDNVDRLLTATGPWAGTFNASYDGRGNIKRQGFTDGSGVEFFSRAYTYDPASELLQQVVETSGTVPTTFAYTYDPRGNVTAKGTQTFAYSDASTMRCANCGTPGESTYAYDGADMRVSTQKNGATTYFMYGSAGNLLWEQTPGAGVKNYIYVGGKQVATHEKQATP